MDRALKKAVLVKLSICECGFGLLNDDITLGTVFTADLNMRMTLTYGCGGCGRIIQPVSCVGVNSAAHPDQFRFLPLEIFKYEPLP